MNAEQVRSFVMTYLEVYQCDIIEKAPTHVTVKLSIEADKELTNRAYYWGFVERTGAPAETMTMTFVFDPPAYQAAKSAKPFTSAAGTGSPATAQVPGAGAGATVAAAGTQTAGTQSIAAAGTQAAGMQGVTPSGSRTVGVPTWGAAGTEVPVASSGVAARPGAGTTTASVAGPAGRMGTGGPPAPGTGAIVSAVTAAPVGGPSAGGTSDSILGRYFGFVPTAVTVRVPTDEVTFGSRRLLQLFQSAKTRGRFVRLFEEPPGNGNNGSSGTAPSYEIWLLVNFKVELICDMKRSEIHSLAISLSSGRIRERFYEEVLLARKLTPRLPDNIRLLPELIPARDAAFRLEAFVESKVRGYDHTWASLASDQLLQELDRIEGYYSALLQAAEPDQRSEIEAQYENRKSEIEWQYRPRIQVSAINCGFFHLQSGSGL